MFRQVDDKKEFLNMAPECKHNPLLTKTNVIGYFSTESNAKERLFKKCTLRFDEKVDKLLCTTAVKSRSFLHQKASNSTITAAYACNKYFSHVEDSASSTYNMSISVIN